MALMQRASALSPACPLYQHVISRFQPEAERRGAGTSDLSTTARCISSARGPLPSSALTQVSSTRMTRASTRCNAERAFQAKALAGVVPSCQCWQSDWWGAKPKEPDVAAGGGVRLLGDRDSARSTPLHGHVRTLERRLAQVLQHIHPRWAE